MNVWRGWRGSAPSIWSNAACNSHRQSNARNEQLFCWWRTSVTLWLALLGLVQQSYESHASSKICRNSAKLNASFGLRWIIRWQLLQTTARSVSGFTVIPDSETSLSLCRWCTSTNPAPHSPYSSSKLKSQTWHRYPWMRNAAALRAGERSRRVDTIALTFPSRPYFTLS